MYRVIIALLPALAWSVAVFGLDALRVAAVAVASCVAVEYLLQRFILRQHPTVSDGSAALTGLLLAFNVPSSLPWWMLVIAAVIAIGVAKVSFGGLGNNPFNPALVGRVFLLISFPVAMTTWPSPHTADIDAATSATPLGLLKEGLHRGKALSELMPDLPSHLNLLTGQTGGSLGEISAALLLLGFAYLLIRKVITWHIPVFVLGTIFIFQGILWECNPVRFADPLFHILTGGAMLGAIFMATDMVTSPMSHRGQLLFGVGIGIITVLIRNFGAYPEGISFAILIMNGFTPLINTYVKPKRFGEKK
jgi:electron transport complex protein RnfD